MKYIYKFEKFIPSFSPSITMNYMIAVPEDYDPKEKLPMVTFLHGAGEVGDDPEKIRVNGPPKYVTDGFDVRMILLAPQVPHWRYVWNNLMEQTMELIKKVSLEYNADSDRISLTGLSMGGYGTWDIAASNSDYFSAIAPICGGGMAWRAVCYGDLPIRTFHGQADDVVSVTNTIDMVDAINAIRTEKVDCVLLREVKHLSWDFAYTQTNLIEWLITQDRKNRKL